MQKEIKDHKTNGHWEIVSKMEVSPDTKNFGHGLGYEDEEMHRYLGEIRFKPSKIDHCLYYQDKVVILIYIDDCIMFSPEKSALNQVIKDICNSPRKFRIKDLGDLKEFLGIQVYCRDDGSITLTQLQLIDCILCDLSFQDNMKGKSAVILQKDTISRSFKNNFHYQSIIGKLNFLEKSTRPDISYVVPQCADFSEKIKTDSWGSGEKVG